MTDKNNYQKFKEAGDRAASAYRWEEAIRCYSVALDSPELDPEVEYGLLDRREYCFNRIARFSEAAQDLDRMIEIAKDLDDIEKLLDAQTRLSITLAYGQEPEKSKDAAYNALKIARESGFDYFAARALYGLGSAEVYSGEYASAAERFAEARQVFSASKAIRDVGWCLYNLAYCAFHTGHDPIPFAEEMEKFVAPLNDLLLEARAQHMLSIAYQNEPAKRRHHLENSLEIYVKIDERSALMATTHNLGIFYFNLGAIKRGHKLFKQSLVLHEKEAIQFPSLLTQHMATLTGFLAGENPEEMLDWNQQVFEESLDTGERNVSAYSAMGRGVMLHLSGRNREAEKWHLRANELLGTLPGYIPNNMAWLSFAYLAMGKTDQALRRTAEALERAEEMPDTPFLYTVMWAHYHASQAAAGDPPEIGDADWDLLDRAAGIILETGEKVHDPGLRRNFLIRGMKTSDLLLEWVSQAHARGVSLDRLSPQPSRSDDLQDPFKRLIEFGNRLTSERSLKDLPAFIMEELIELSGAERAFIALTDGENGPPLVLQDYELSEDEIQQIRDELAGAFEQAALSQQPLIQGGIGEIPEGEAPPIYLRSAIILPLVQADRVMGAIYADVREVFGPFTRADADLLGVLANQAAAALENARWSEGLEQQVAERTEDLTRRNAEMAIINRVQQGLVEKLEIDAICELVGEELRKIFDSDVFVSFYDPETDMNYTPYVVEHGKRLEVKPYKVDGKGFLGQLIRNPQTLLINEGFEAEMEKAGAKTVEGTYMPKSSLAVPLVRDGLYRGALALQNMEREHAFSESDVRLMETIADSMSVALENARLFDETQQLLKETEERNAELAVINSVQEGLVAELDIQGIYDLVGDKLVELFDAQAISILTLDHANEQIITNYLIEKGERHDGDPVAFTEFTRYLAANPGLIHIPKDFSLEEAEQRFNWVVTPGTERPKASVFAPLMIGSQVNGVISLQNIDRGDAFSDADVRLLATLANSMSVALENARLFDETQRLLKETEERNAELAVINSVQEGLVSRLDIQEIYNLVGEKIREIFDAQVLVIQEFDHDSGIATERYIIEKGERYEIDAHPFLDTDRYIIKHKKPVHIPDNLEVRFEEIFGRAPTAPVGEMPKSAYVVPMLLGDRVLGAISMQNIDREGAFSEADRRLLQTLANSMTVALENARLFAETEQRNAELAIINSVQSALAAELDIQGIYKAVGDKIVEIFESDAVVIQTFDREAGFNHMRYSYELGKHYEPDTKALTKFHHSLIALTDPLVVNENAEEILAEMGAIIVEGSEIPKSAVYVPMFSGGRVFAAISIQNVEAGKPFGEDDVRLLQTLANSMSVALENARLFDETQRLLEETEARNAELAVINSVQEGLAAELDIQGIYETVGDKVREIFDQADMMIRIYDPETDLVHFPYVYEDGKRIAVDPTNLGGIASHIIGDRQTLVINEDMEEAVERFDTFILPGTQVEKSVVYVPLIAGDQALGLIQLIDMHHEHAFNPQDVRLLQTVASSMSIALENARLFNETNRRANEMAALTEIGREISSTLEQEVVLERIAAQARDLLKARDVVIRLLQVDGETLDAVVALGPYADKYRASSARLGEGITGDIALTGTGEIINYPSKDRRARHVPGTPQAEEDPDAIMIVPLQSGDKVIGTMGLWRMRETGLFTDADLKLLESLARQAAIAILNAQLYEDSQRRAEEMAALAEIGNEIATTLEMTPVLERIVAKAGELLKVRDIAVFLLDSDEETLRAPVARGAYADEIKATTVKLGEGITGSIAVTGVPEIVNHPLEDPRSVRIEGTPEEEEGPLMAAPLLSRGKTIGVLTAWLEGVGGQFAQSDLDFLVSLARQAAIAIESARLYLETQARAEELAALNRIGQEIASTLELQTVLERMAESARGLLGGSTSAVYLLEADRTTLRCSIATGTIAEELRNIELKLGEGILGSIVKNGRAEIINDTSKDSRSIHIPGTDQSDQGEKLVGAPLLSKGEVLGVMAVWRDAREPLFDETGLNVLIGLAQQAAVSVENASLFEEVERQRQYSEALVQNSPVAIVTTDLEAIVVSWNPAAENLFGYEIYEAVGKNLDSLIAANGELMDEAVEITRQTAQEVRINSVTQRARKDGTRVDVELLALPVVLNGERVGMIAIYHDISERVKAENALRQQKQYFEALFQNSPVAFVTADRNFRIVEWNPVAEKVFGYTQDEAVGQFVDDLVATHPEVQEEAAAFNFRAEEGEFIRAITKRNRKDGSLIDLEVLVMPVLVAEEQVGMLVIYHDISELLEARKEAESANEAKSAFLATMSHEIRTPMNAIIGMSGLMMDTELSAEQHEFADVIRTSGDALLAIINDILDFSKIEAGRMDLEEEPIDLRELLESSIDLIRIPASQKGLDLAYEMDPTVPPAILGDATRLRQILINLLNNAVKFTESGEVVLEVQSARYPSAPLRAGQARGSLHFSVRDTGIGIPADRVDRLFQAFSQVDASTSRRYGGTGLGLAISKSLAELMGGEMWVESVEGEGSNFHFTIRAEPAPELEVREHLTGEQPELAGKRLLVVDDNPTNRRILSLQTKNWGMIARDTDSPALALKWLERGDPIDLAIIDMHMPGMEGVELAERIRELPGRADLPLILFSSLSGRELKLDDSPFSDHLQKPLKQSLLFDTLMNVFSTAPVSSRRSPVRSEIDTSLGEKLSLRILLTEDNAVNQKVALRILERMGFQADIAANGLEALEAVRRQPYDVVLMDVQMPEMDGLEATRKIRHLASLKDLPSVRIIAMTANATEEDRRACFEAGMDDYIAKPIRVEELADALSRSKPK